MAIFSVNIREESGLCATFFAKHYDGERLLIPLTKVIIYQNPHMNVSFCKACDTQCAFDFCFEQENMKTHKQNTLYDIMRLEGNQSALPADILEAIKSSFFVM
jgi:hypothetical protein